MTPQIKLAAIGALAAGISKFYFGKDSQTALLFGFAAISAVALLTAHKDESPAS